MNIIPFVHEGLGNSSYLVGFADGEAMLVDPDRSVERYLQVAAARDWRISAVLETHLHADFVSGALEVAAATGARLFIPAEGHVAFPHVPVAPGDPVSFAGHEVGVIPTPGHTPEHLAYVLRSATEPPRLFSGGSLIVGGAARTDLLSPSLTDRLTRAQFRTLNSAFRGLPDETVLLPTHGGGSFCSAGAGGERSSNLGHERRNNPLLQVRSEEEFARSFPASFPAAPGYFFRMRAVNQAGPRLRSVIPTPPALEPHEFARLAPRAQVVDVRPQAEFLGGHVPGALSNTFRDSFATWLGWLIPPREPLLFVLGDEPLERVIDESLLVGLEDFAGFLVGGMDAWRKAGLPVAQAGLATAPEARDILLAGGVALDVREPDEFAIGHIPNAIHIPLGSLPGVLTRLPGEQPIVAYCGHGERAATALSLLQRAGFSGLTNIDGGIGAWQESGLEVTQAV